MHSVYIFSLHTIPHEVCPEGEYFIQPSPNPYPKLVVHELTHLKNFQSLGLVSCVKHTKTGMWLDWSRNDLYEAGLLPDEQDESIPPTDFQEMLNFMRRINGEIIWLLILFWRFS